MLENFTTDTFTYEKLSKDEMERRGILGRLVGVIADSKNPTRNGRLYNSDLWNRVFDNPIMREKIENNCVFGQLGHPEDREEVDMEKIAICMDGLPKKNSKGQLMGVFNIIDTPCGRILKSLCDYGCNIGISSRGTGDIITDYDGNEMVDPDTYNCECFDAVLVPGVQAARLQYVTESLDKTRYKKTLRDRLTESINNEDTDKQKAMRESLHDIGIDLDESLFTESDYEPKFINDMTVDELKAEEKEYYDAQYQYGKSLPMNRIWDIDYTIKELEKNSLNESLEVPELDSSINGVMGAYQNANKWLDSVKEFVYTDLSCPFFSSFVHELAHTMPGRFDKFGDILHTANIEVPYPTTLELENMPTSINDVFDIIFNCLDDIKNNLNSFIKATDENYHGMACSAEGLLNDIESEYPMLYRMRDKWNQCNNDLVDFDKFVAQYTEHKEDLLESVDKDILVYDSEAAKTDLFDVVSPQEMADTFDKPVKDGDEIYYPQENENISYKDTEIIDNEDGTFTVTIDGETQVFNSIKNAKTWINMMKPQVDESLYVSAGKMNDELLGNAVKEFSDNAGDYGDALTFVKDKFSQYSLNDQKDISRYINKNLSESLKTDRVAQLRARLAYVDNELANAPVDMDTTRYDVEKAKILDELDDLGVSYYEESLIEAQVDAKTSIKRLGYELKNSGDEIPGAMYINGTQARVGDTVYDSNKDDFFTIVAARQDGEKVLIVKNNNMNHGDTTILSPGSPRWNKFSLKDRNAFRGSLTEAQVGRDDIEPAKSIEDVDSDNAPSVQPVEPEKKEEKETTIIIKEDLNSTEENAADAALSELRELDNVDKNTIRDTVARVVNRYNTENVGPDYEDDPFAFEEADYFRVLDYVENKINKSSEENKSEEDINNNIDNIEEAVDNNEVNDIDKIYEMFNKNANLEKKLTDLQEKLSASYARETKLREELGKYKNQVKQLAENSRQVEILEGKLERANSQISEIENGISANEHKFNESLENSNRVKSKLTESIRQRDSRIKSLEKELESTKKQNIAQLNENKTLQKEHESLQESYADAQKDVAQLKEQYSKRLQQKNELIEKYQKIATKAVDKYIDSQAVKLGITSNEIRNKLPKGYGFKDIDSICESLQEYKININTLPFDTRSLNEGVSIKARNVRQELLPRNEEDEITDLELELAKKMLQN